MPSIARLLGADEMGRRMRGAVGQLGSRVAKAQYVETEIEATECKRRTPVDTGALRDSIHVVGPLQDGKTITTVIVAGGPSAPYAAEVHENLWVFHKVGGAKFIESVLRESAKSILGRISRRAQGL